MAVQHIIEAKINTIPFLLFGPPGIDNKPNLNYNYQVMTYYNHLLHNFRNRENQNFSCCHITDCANNGSICFGVCEFKCSV